MRDVTLIRRVQEYVNGAGFGDYMRSFDPWCRMYGAVQASCERVGLDGFIPLQREAIDLWCESGRKASDELKPPVGVGSGNLRDLHQRCYQIYGGSGGDEIDAMMRDSVSDFDDRLLAYVKQHKDLPTAYDSPDTRKNRQRGGPD
jgi:hypothetical protein